MSLIAYTRCIDSKLTGQRIRARRKRCRVTLDQLATMVGVCKPFLSRIETGQRELSPELAAKIEAALRSPQGGANALPSPV